MKKKFTFMMAVLILLSFLTIPTGLLGQYTYEVTNSIAVGDVVVLVNHNDTYELTGISSTSTKYGIGTSFTGTPNATYPLTVEAGYNNNGFAFKTNDNKYLYWGSSNSLNVNGSKSANTSWTVSITSGVATITNNADDTRSIRWNNNSGQYRFACYTSGQQNVKLYKRVATGPTLTSLTYEGSPTINSYEAGDYFVSTGLTIIANYSDNTTANVTDAVTWTPSPLIQGTTSVTASYGGQSVTINNCITVSAASAADIVLNKDNSPFTSNSSSNTNTETVTLDGIEYENYAGYIFSNRYLSFNRNANGYLGNKTVLCGNIKKIVVSFSTATAYSCFTMYEGATALSETTIVAANPKTSGNTHTATYMFNRNNGYFKYKLTTTGNYCNINSISIYLEDCANPAITVSTNSLTGFTYIETHGPSAPQTFTVSGEYLTANLSMTLDDNSAFEISQSEDSGYTNAINLERDNNGAVSSTTIYARLKENKTKGNYSGTITLTSTDATDKTVSLSGNVTGQIYNITVTPPAGGTIVADKESAEADATVTLTATPSDAYTFNNIASNWTISPVVTVTPGANNTATFTMPASNVTVSATFDAKPTHTTTCTVTGSGTVTAAPASTYEGQTVTLTIAPETGWYLSSITATYNDGATQTLTLNGSGNTRTFTMPNYAVAVAATFLSNTYEGDFVLFTGDFEEGDYILVYDGGAMNNTVSSSRFGITDVDPSDSNIISNPSNDIVWHIAPSATEDDYWTIYNAKETKYVNAVANGTTVSLVDNPNNNNQAQWGVSNANNKYSFRCKANESYSARYIGRNGEYGFANYGSSYGVALTLYKYAAPVTITFDGNGGTYNNEETYTQEVYSGMWATLNANQFVKSNFGFASWNTEQNGSGTSYADGGNIKVAANTTLYAQWATPYTALVANEIVGGTVKIIVGNEQLNSYTTVADTEITLSATAKVGYNFSAWNVKDSDNMTVTVTNNKFTMPAKNVTISATFEEVTTYRLVTNVADLVSGAHYYIASGANGSVKAMSAQGDNIRSVVDATSTTGAILVTANVYEFVINGPDEDGYYTIYDVTANTGGYLYASSSSGNNIGTQSAYNDNGRWSIDIDNTGAADIEAQGSNTRNLMRFNGDRFSCYGSGTSVSGRPYLYMKYNDTDLEFYGQTAYTGEATISSNVTLDANNKITIKDGGKVTFTGTLINNNADYLIIEDGGQLIIPSAKADVKATFQKEITAYTQATGKDNYYLIANPTTSSIDPENVDGMLDETGGNDYDLYYFDEAQSGAEWRNYKKETFNLENGKGYLYANTTGHDLEFSGTVRPGTTASINLSKSGSGTYNGFNLVGNPLSNNVRSMKIGESSCSYYKVNSSTGVFAVSEADIIVGEAFMVEAPSDEATLTLNPSAKDEAGFTNEVIRLEVSNSKFTDVAYVYFGNHLPLTKINHLNDEAPMLYIHNENSDKAVEVYNNRGEVKSINVNFEAKTIGTYTISAKMVKGEIKYMHLYDRFTGIDTDLLIDDYSFIGANEDQPGRFILKLEAIDNEFEGSDNFAYQSGNNIMVNGEGELQIFDVMGRLVMNERINGVEAISGLSRGIYIFRVIGETQKTQKIVVR